MATKIQNKVQWLLNKFRDGTVGSDSVDGTRSHGYFRFSPGMGAIRDLGGYGSITYWASIHGVRHLHHRTDIKHFWNWLYLNERKNNLNEEDLLTVMSGEILCDGTLRYQSTAYLLDSPYLVRDSLIFALQSSNFSTLPRSFSINVASSTRLHRNSGVRLHLNPGNKSTQIADWNME